MVCVLHRLAAHINGYKCFQIELTRGYDYKAFHEDLKSLFTMTGIKGEDTVFLFTDTQVRHCNSHRLLHIRSPLVLGMYVEVGQDLIQLSISLSSG